jgi:hypothetical protein
MRTIQLVVLAPQICSCFLLKLSSKPKPTLRFMSLKPAATSLMDSGKALARSGEFLIDLTQDLDLYGGTYCMIAEFSTSCFLNLILSRNCMSLIEGGLSAAGAQIRNAGDSVAQAAASCRFKTGSELVTDELREAATCLIEACSKLKTAVEEARQDNLLAFADTIGSWQP